MVLSCLCFILFFCIILRPPRSTRTDALFPSPPLFRSVRRQHRMTVLGAHRTSSCGSLVQIGGRRTALRLVLEGEQLPQRADEPIAPRRAGGRSEENTSEHQSRMLRSEAVLCLRTKTE